MPRFILIMSLLGAVRLFAQSSATLTGQVTDQSGAAMPRVQVIATAVESAVEHKTTTNESGYYTVPSLTSGNYMVSAQVPGFKQAVSAVFKLDTTATARIDMVLLPADVKEVVEVTATAPAIVTESGTSGTTVTQKEIEAMPLDGRNSLELAMTVGGVMGSVGSDDAGIYNSIPSPGSVLSIAGGGRRPSPCCPTGQAPRPWRWAVPR